MENKEKKQPNIPELLMAEARKLGFSETPDMVRVREKLQIWDFTNIDEQEFNKLMTDYVLLGQGHIDTLPAEATAKASIGLILYQAAINYKCDLWGYFDGCLEDAINYCLGMNEDELIKKLEGFEGAGLQF